MLSPMEQVNWVGKLADLKTSHADSLHLLHALIELLIEKQLISKDELIGAITSLDSIPLKEQTNHPKG